MTEQENVIPRYQGNIGAEFLNKVLTAFSKYKSDKAELEGRIQGNNKWYKARYWSLINPKSNDPQPATAYIFNAIMHKYADAVDNFPCPNFLEREKEDADTARTLSKLVPAQLEIGRFKEVYKECWLSKLKHGTGCYGVFYDEANNDIILKNINLLNVYADMHIQDIQDSPFLFITNTYDNAQLKEKYPEYRMLFENDAQIKTSDGDYKVEDRTEIVDCYYKKYSGGERTLQMLKLCGEHIIEATEDMEGYESGLYDHGEYPVVLDVLYRDEDSPFGFGVIDVVKNPQIYVDKLDSIILKNALISGKIRFLLKDNAGINESELKDLNCDIVHAMGGVNNDTLRELQASPLAGFITEHREKKINELKEVIGNRDFQQGGTSGGVTAASAISVLQQAGEKLSRAMIDDSYDSYKKIVLMVIELMRQFYTEEHTYRITNEQGQPEYTPFSNMDLMHPVAVMKDALGFPIDTIYKKAEFDITVVPQRQNPFSKEANNQTIVQLFQMGLFNPQNLDISLIVLQALQFDGKDKIIADLQELQQRQQVAQQQVLMQQQAMSGSKIEDLGNGYSAVDLGQGNESGIKDLGNGYSEIDLGGQANG